MRVTFDPMAHYGGWPVPLGPEAARCLRSDYPEYIPSEHRSKVKFLQRRNEAFWYYTPDGWIPPGTQEIPNV